MIRRTLLILASLRLTVVCLVCGLVLVFIGTLAQVDHGLYQAQTSYFRSFAVWWSPGGTGFAIPVFPGGYTLGVVLLVNLVAAHAQRFSLHPNKLGILAIHFGLIVLLIGQIASDVLSEEGTMRIARGETASYSEDLRMQELAIIDGNQAVAATPADALERTTEIGIERLGLTISVPAYWPDAQLLTEPAEGALPVTATQGPGTVGLYVLPLVDPRDADERTQPAAVVEVATPDGPLGSYLVSPQLRAPQTFEVAGRTLEIALGPKRRYLPYSMTLVDLRHDVYTGTDIPRDFSSRLRIRNPATSEDREVVISMNHPLRYQGDTYYQYQMEEASDISVLQVVRNPGWLTPYLSCGLVGVGLVVQFAGGLLRFARRDPA
jgi:hypothetical protein